MNNLYKLFLVIVLFWSGCGSHDTVVSTSSLVFDPSRVLYDVEYKKKNITPDTTLTFDMETKADVNISWTVPSGFNTTGETPDYDKEAGWTTLVVNFDGTATRQKIEIIEGTYSFRVWSKYVYESGNVVRSLSPSDEYIVMFDIKQEEFPPKKIVLPLEFEIVTGN